MAGAISTIKRSKPVLYFEYARYLFTKKRAQDVNKVLCLAAMVGGYSCTIPAKARGELAFCLPDP